MRPDPTRPRSSPVTEWKRVGFPTREDAAVPEISGFGVPQLGAPPACGGLPISVERPVTKYERKALAGPDVTELVWEKQP